MAIICTALWKMEKRDHQLGIWHDVKVHSLKLKISQREDSDLPVFFEFRKPKAQKRKID